MIPLNELRVGNIVKHSDISSRSPSKEPFACTLFDLAYHELLDPIPLTEEILVKCGFVKGERTSSVSDDNFKYPVLWLNPYTRIKTNCSGGNSDYLFLEDNYRVDCKYLHQLQNLYFALTGTELNFNNKI